MGITVRWVYQVLRNNMHCRKLGIVSIGGVNHRTTTDTPHLQDYHSANTLKLFPHIMDTRLLIVIPGCSIDIPCLERHLYYQPRHK